MSRIDGAPKPVGNGAFEVSGSASDSGGVVGGVEVSIDGGKTWHPADGTAKWRYRFEAASAPAAAAVISRAVDDSGNLQRVGGRE